MNRHRRPTDEDEQIQVTREYIERIRRTHPSASLSRALDDLEQQLNEQEDAASGKHVAAV